MSFLESLTSKQKNVQFAKSNNFIEEKFRSVHGDKYDYSKFIYRNAKEKGIVICPLHGEFLISYDKHYSRKQGCPKCGIEKHRLTKEQFIEKAKAIHGNKYSYDKVEYINNDTKVIITCPKHGDFEILPRQHLSGSGCKYCYYERKGDLNRSPEHSTKRLTTEEFIEKAKKVHPNKDYDYSFVNYINNVTPVDILCKEHGIFSIRPNNLLNGQGCYECGRKSKSLLNTNLLERLENIHGKDYKFLNLNDIKNIYSKVKVVCPNNHEYETPLYSLIRGHSCKQCETLDRQLTKEEFIEKAKAIHGDKYNYSLLDNLVRTRDIIPIICPDHGVFYQNANNHLRGNYFNDKGCGCPSCSESKSERNFTTLLNSLNIRYIKQYKIEEFSNVRYKFDFFLVDYGLLVELHGQQHFELINHFHNEDFDFIKQKERDKIKEKMAKVANKKLLIITYRVFDFILRDNFKNIFENLLKDIVKENSYNFKYIIDFDHNNLKFKIDKKLI